MHRICLIVAPPKLMGMANVDAREKEKKEERNTYRNASRNEMLSSDDVEECIHSLREHSMADGKLCIYLVYTRHNNANGNEIASN